jgi:hypothetical protein
LIPISTLLRFCWTILLKTISLVPDMTAAGYRQLEAVNMETLFVGVSQQPAKIKPAVI